MEIQEFVNCLRKDAYIQHIKIMIYIQFLQLIYKVIHLFQSNVLQVGINPFLVKHHAQRALKVISVRKRHLIQRNVALVIMLQKLEEAHVINVQQDILVQRLIHGQYHVVKLNIQNKARHNVLTVHMDRNAHYKKQYNLVIAVIILTMSNHVPLHLIALLLQLGSIKENMNVDNVQLEVIVKGLICNQFNVHKAIIQSLDH